MNFKFGVLYAKDGQLTDDEMFSNGECLPSFLLTDPLFCLVAVFTVHAELAS